MTTLLRWSASRIIETFVKNPYSKIRMSESDKKSWELNTDGYVTIKRTTYPVEFRLISRGIYEASIPSYQIISYAKEKRS